MFLKFFQSRKNIILATLLLAFFAFPKDVFAENLFSVGSGASVLTATSSAIFANISNSSPASTFMLMLQKAGNELFKVDTFGNVTLQGTLTMPNSPLTTSISAANITSGEFGSVIGAGGNYVFGSTVSGNVGIGITPTVKLHVQGNGTTAAAFMNGNVGIGLTNPIAKLSISGSLNADEPRLSFVASDNSQRFTIETDLDSTTSNDLLGIRSSSVDDMLVLKGNGNVGIGTANPTSLFHVESPTSATTLKVVGGGVSGTRYTGPYLNLVRKGIYDQFGINYYTESTLNWFTGIPYTGGTASANRFIIGPSSSIGTDTVLLLRNGGFVGINNANPQAALDVVGQIKMTNSNITTSTDVINKGYLDSIVTPSSSPTAGTQFGFWTAGTANSIYNNNSGNVGIGTTNPEGKLEIVGSGPLKLSDSGGNMYLENSDSWGMKWKFAGNSDTVEMNASETAWKFNIAGGGVTRYRFSSTKAGSVNGPILDLNTNGSSIFYGNVGIGTTAPRAKLEVNGDILVPNGQSVLSRDSGDNVSVPLFKFVGDTLSIGNWEGSYVGGTYIKGGNGSVFTDFSAGNNANFIVRKVSGATPTELMRVNVLGNVGIGTPSPSVRLDLGGGTAGRITGLDTAPAAVRGDSEAVPKKWIVDNFASAIGIRKSFNFTNTNNVQYYLIARLPAENSSYAEGLMIETTGHTSSTQGKGKLTVSLGQRSGFWYTKNYENNPRVHVVVYKNVDGTSNVYVYTPAANYTSGDVLYYQFGWKSGVVLYDDPVASTTIPSGTLIFDSNDDVTYPVNDSLMTGKGIFLNNVGIGTTAPSVRLDLGGGTAGRITGLDTAPAAVRGDSEAVPKKWIVDNFAPAVGGASLWATSTAGIYNVGLGNVGVGTSAPLEKLDIFGSLRLSNIQPGSGIYGWSNNNTNQVFSLTRQDAGVTGSLSISAYGGIGLTGNRLTSPATSNYDLFVNNSGNVGIGLTNPTTPLQFKNNSWISSQNSLGTGVVNMFKVNASNQIEVGAPLNIGSFEFSPDSGLVSFVDMPVSAAPGNGALQGYAFRIDGNNLMTLYSEANGLGGIKNTGLGIGTAAPGAKLDIVGALRTTSATISLLGNSGNRIVMTDDSGNLYATSSSIASGLPAPIAGNKNFTLRSDGANWIANSLIYNNGTNVGIGTTNPTYKLDVYGDGNATTISGVPATMIMGFRNSTGRGAAFDTYDADGTVVIHSTYSGTGLAFGTRFNPGSGAENFERIRIQPNGDIGIGTTTPTAKLEVNGSFFVSGAFSSVKFDSLKQVGAVNRVVTVDEDGTISATSSSIATGLPAPTTANKNFTLRSTGSVWEASPIIYNNGANVGIGTTAPQSTLMIFDGNKVPNGYITNSNLSVITSNAVTDNVGGSILLGGANGQSQSPFGFGLIKGAKEPGGTWGGYLSFYTTKNNSGMYEGMRLDSDGNIGIGTTTPSAALDIKGKLKVTSGGIIYNELSNYRLDLSGILPVSLLTAKGAGIGTTNPLGMVGVLQGMSNYNTAFTAPHLALTAGSAVDNTGFVGITYGASTSANYGWSSGALRSTNGQSDFVWKYHDNNAVGIERLRITKEGFVGIGTSTPSVMLDVAGAAKIGGDLNMSGKDITNVNKLTVATIDPLYRINGVNYSSFAASLVGGVKEEYLGRVKISKRNSAKEYEYRLDFSKIEKGSDLWVWRQTVDFSPENVEVSITPYGAFANTYYFIENNAIILRADKVVNVSYRLSGKRHDWQAWPTRANDQLETPSFIINNGKVIE